MLLHKLMMNYVVNIFIEHGLIFILKIKITFTSFTDDYNKIFLNMFVGT